MAFSAPDHTVLDPFVLLESTTEVVDSNKILSANTCSLRYELSLGRTVTTNTSNIVSLGNAG